MIDVVIFSSQYQVSSTLGSSEMTTSKQNGNTPAIKATTIHISDVDPSSNNSNNNSSSPVEAARSRGLPASVVQFLADMPEPVRAPTDSDMVHPAQDVEEWERRRAWRDRRERELQKEVNRVHDLISNVAADTQDKPRSDTSN